MRLYISAGFVAIFSDFKLSDLNMLMNSVGHNNLVYKVKSISVESITILSLSSIELDKGTARCFSLKP